jgi:hypothetical protein
VAEILVRVCDIDMNPGPSVRHYEITVDGKEFALDLCDRHAGPLAELGREGGTHRQTKRAPAKRTGGTSRRQTVTLEEIEAMKNT